MQQNKERLMQLSVAKRMTDEVVREIKKIEQENYTISKEINKRRYELHTVAFANPNLYEIGNEKITSGSKIFMMNQACNYEVEFKNRTFLVAEIKYMACSENWLRQSIQKFNNNANSNK